MAKENISGFDGWVFDFKKHPDLIQNGVNEVREHLRERFNSFPKGKERIQHLFVFVHGVGDDTNFGGSFSVYIEWFSRLYQHYVEEHYVGDQPPIDRKDITILGVNWNSQNMGEMLGLLLSFEETKMPAQGLAEGDLKNAINQITSEYRGQVRVHLTGHSMGAQVLLYLLPKLADDVEIGSMMFLQGFAPSSAFGEPGAEGERKKALRWGSTETLFQRTLFPLYDLLRSLNPPKIFGKGVDLDLEVKNRVIDPKVNALIENTFKVTGFANHLGKVGPILATTTGTLWADYQVGIAEISFYSPPGVLGVRGFQGDKVKTYKVQDVDGKEQDQTYQVLHDVDDDEIEGGKAAYDFTIDGKRFFNLRADPYYITDHDDFKNRAIAYAHLRAAGVINNDIVTRARSSRRTDPDLPDVHPETWMKDTWRVIGERTLTQVCMPGSHDSGMGIISHVLAPSAEKLGKLVGGYVEEKARRFTEGDLTKLLTSGTIDHVTRTALETARGWMPRLCVTQTSRVREQLRQGCRFFDLRPAWWEGKEKEKKKAGFYLAHGEHQTFPRSSGDVDLGYIGGIGESLEAALEAVASFASEKVLWRSAHSSELIVLKFSHAADWAHLGRAFPAERKKPLFETIRGRLGNVMINREVPAGQYIDDIPLNELVKGGKTVLCIYEQALYDKSLNSNDLKGVYWCPGDPDTPADKPQINCRLYDKYADSRNFAYVIGDQWWKFKKKMEDRQKDKAKDQVFLLSWIATLKPGPGIMDMRSVLDNAQVLNKKLHLSMKNWIQRGDINGAARPNIVYVDAYDATVLDTVAMINAVDLKSKPFGL